MLYELILINEIEQRAKIIFLSVSDENQQLCWEHIQQRITIWS